MTSESSTDNATGQDAGSADLSVMQIDEFDLRGLSALLTVSPFEPAVEFGDRRTGRDRRTGDRRIPGEASEAKGF